MFIQHDAKKIRKRIWYQRWMNYLDELEKGGVTKANLMSVGMLTHRLLNNVCAYGSITKADYAQESLRQAVLDKVEKMMISRLQLLPSPDEAPVTSCPHCGVEYITNETNIEDYYEVAFDGENPIFRHKPCGGLVHFLDDDSEEVRWEKMVECAEHRQELQQDIEADQNT